MYIKAVLICDPVLHSGSCIFLRLLMHIKYLILWNTQKEKVEGWKRLARVTEENGRKGKRRRERERKKNDQMNGLFSKINEKKEKKKRNWERLKDRVYQVFFFPSSFKISENWHLNKIKKDIIFRLCHYLDREIFFINSSLFEFNMSGLWVIC